MISTLIPILMLSVATIGTPGPANMAIMGASARFGLNKVWPFVFGVIFGKQVIIWPVGLGLLQIADAAPNFVIGLKAISAAYMLYLAWKIAGMSLKGPDTGSRPPGFIQGLIVHPLNPKAWALITFVFSGMAPDLGAAWRTTLLIAGLILLVQLVLQPLWGILGNELAKRLTGKAERPFFIVLAVLMVVSIAWAFGGIQ